MKKIGARMWIILVLFGLVGQLAWTLENMYFNVFVYNVFGASSDMIATMVAASAATATVTTLLMGALSDRIGRRKPFICGGYILWGLTVCAFAFLSVENLSAIVPAASVGFLGSVLVIILDCIMTFFGSTANDAALNAYITDRITPAQRGRTEGVLSVLPLLSMLIVFGGFDAMTQNGQWKEFFLIFGILTVLVGILGLFLIREPHAEPHKNNSYFSDLFYGFRPSVIKANVDLYLALAAFAVFSIAMQVHYPYLIIYMQNYLQFDNYALALGVVLIVASIASVLAGRLIEKVGRLPFFIGSSIVLTVGLVLMYGMRDFWPVVIAGIVMMSGYLALTAVGNAIVRDATPKDKAGMFQGIRMIFYVLIPMVTGPYIGAAVIANSGQTYTELGVVKQVPTPAIFLTAAICMLALTVPLFFMIRRNKRNAAK